MSWMFLRDLLSGVNKYSAGIGRLWLAVVFIFRLLVYIVAVEHVWKDEQREFECNIRQPGCETVCFDHFFPISQAEWIVRETKRKVFLLIVKTGFEIGFLVLFYKLYDGFRVPYLLKCALQLCPNTVDCFISKPTEKTIFILFLVITSCLRIVLNFIELSFLVLRCFIKRCLKRYSKNLRASGCERHNFRCVGSNKMGTPAILQNHHSGLTTGTPRQPEAKLLCDTQVG